MYISITNFPGMFSVTSYVPTLQARYQPFVELDTFVGLVHKNDLRKNNPASFWLCLFCVVSYKTRQHLKNDNVLRITLPEMLQETLIT